MKRYTEILPNDLAEKLSRCGMPIEEASETPNGEYSYRVTYADVFDWLAEKGITIEVTRMWTINGVRNAEKEYNSYLNVTRIALLKPWYEAANKAIEFAINKMKKQ